jgi:nickel transport protein
MKIKRVFVMLALLVVLSCVSISEVSAHRLLIDQEIGEIGIKAYFEGGGPCRDANVKVYDNESNLYVEGVTDDKGTFGFPPKMGVEEYTVTVDAVHMPGHKAKTVINLSQVAAGADTGAGSAGGIEMPLYTRIIAGFGYIIGLAGAAMAYVGWKLKKKYEGR